MPARLLCLSLACMLAAACSNDPNPPPLRATRADGSPWLARYTSLPDDPRSLDPQFAYEETSRRVLEPIYDTLLEYDPMQTDPYRVIPCLLAALPERMDNADGSLSYLCRLKPGIRFHDDPCFPGGQGREVIASDVLFAIQRLSDPRVESPVFGPLSEFIAGMREAHAAAATKPFAYDEPLRGVELIDHHTFKLHLLKPYPQIIYWLAMHFTCPVPQEAVRYYDGKFHPESGRQRAEFRFHPVGNGPFRMTEYVPGQRVRLIRNDHYHTTTFPTGGWPAEKEALLRPVAGKQLPLIDELQLTIFRDVLPIFVLNRQGYLDGMGVSKDAFNSIVTPTQELSEDYKKRGMTLEKDIAPSTFFLTLNCEDPVLGTNKKLRQAISCSFNAQAYCDIFFNSVPPVAQQLVPPGLYGFQPEYRNPYGFDLEKARRLLEEAGYPGGVDARTGERLVITLDVVATGGQERQMAEFTQRQLEQLGIRVPVVENTFPRMMAKQDSGAFQIASGSGWGADYPDPENFFFLFYSKNIPPAGKNASRYRNPGFDALFDRMATMDPGPERLGIIHQMNAMLNEDCPNVLEFHRANYVMVQPFAPRSHNNMMLEGGFKYSTLDYGLREAKRREWNRRPMWPMALLGAVMVAGVVYGVRVNRRRVV